MPSSFASVTKSSRHTRGLIGRTNRSFAGLVGLAAITHIIAAVVNIWRIVCPKAAAGTPGARRDVISASTLFSLGGELSGNAKRRRNGSAHSGSLATQFSPRHVPCSSWENDRNFFSEDRSASGYTILTEPSPYAVAVQKGWTDFRGPR
eukprot:4100301-Prymnesium_polylepis.1